MLAAVSALLFVLERVIAVPQIVIGGGSLSALAAAVTAANVSQALEWDVDVILLEPTDWAGGQLTSSNVPPDFGRQNSIPQNLPASFVALLENSINDPGWKLNPGDCWVSYKCFEAQLAANFIRDSLLPHFPRLKVLYNTVVKKAIFDASTSRITAIEAIQRTPIAGTTGYENLLSRDLTDWYSPADSRTFTKRLLTFHSPAVVIEATEFGDVLSTAGVTHSLGVETPTEESDVTNENCGQSTVLPFYMKLSSSPSGPDLVPSGSDGGQPFSLRNLTWDKSWTYRRSFSAQPTNASMASTWDSSNQNLDNDYGGGYLFASAEDAERWSGGLNLTALAAAEQRSYGYYHFVKSSASTERRPKLYMPTEQTGTSHGLSKTPYLRESRRAKRGLDGFRLLYAHLNASNPEDGGATATHFNDTVAIGVYHYADMHLLQHCTYPEYITCSITPCNHSVRPYYIPFRALTAHGVDNMLVSGKSMAQSFLANAATRLHPTEWSTGVAAGAAAAMMAAREWSASNVYDAVGELQVQCAHVAL
jgi:hypothetical protein